MLTPMVMSCKHYILICLALYCSFDLQNAEKTDSGENERNPGHVNSVEKQD